MKPFYDEGGITIYHGDCQELLPVLSADAAAKCLAQEVLPL